MKMMYYCKVDRHHHPPQLMSSSLAAVHGTAGRGGSFSAGDEWKLYKDSMVKYCNPRTAAIMAVLTLSLLVLPLVLPPLPPPPEMIMMVPVLIMILLIFLAFSPSRIPLVAHNNGPVV